MSYNGWKNYETWNVALWIDNDEGTESFKREMAQEAIEDAWDGANSDDDNRNDAASRLESTLEQWVRDELVPDVGGLAGDLLNAALSEVDWREIAAHAVADEELPEREEATA